MITIHHKIEEDTVITEDTELFGMIVGLTTVRRSVHLELLGMVVGNLVVERDASVNLRGMVTGDVANKGGNLSVFGMVGGNLVREGGQTLIDSKSVIKGGIT